MLHLVLALSVAVGSGVETASQFFSVSVEVPPAKDPERQALRRKDDERAMAFRIRKTIEGEIEGLKKRYPIIAYSKRFPEVDDAAADGESAREIVKNPFRCRFLVKNAHISFAFASLPPRAVRRALQQELMKLVK